MKLDITLYNFLPTTLDCGSTEYTVRDKCIGCGHVPVWLQNIVVMRGHAAIQSWKSRLWSHVI